MAGGRTGAVVEISLALGEEEGAEPGGCGFRCNRGLLPMAVFDAGELVL